MEFFVVSPSNIQNKIPSDKYIWTERRKFLSSELSHLRSNISLSFKRYTTELDWVEITISAPWAVSVHVSLSILATVIKLPDDIFFWFQDETVSGMEGEGRVVIFLWFEDET